MKKQNKSKKIDTFEFMVPSKAEPGDMIFMSVQKPGPADTREFISRMVGDEVRIFLTEKGAEIDMTVGMPTILVETSTAVVTVEQEII